MSIKTLEDKIIGLRFNLANAQRDADEYPDIESDVHDHAALLDKAVEQLVRVKAGEKIEVDPREAKLAGLREKYELYVGKLDLARTMNASDDILDKLKGAIQKKTNEITAMEDTLAGVDRETADAENKQLGVEIAALRAEALKIGKQIEAKLSRQRQLAPRKLVDARSDKEMLDDAVSNRRDEYKKRYGALPSEGITGHVKTRMPGSEVWT